MNTGRYPPPKKNNKIKIETAMKGKFKFHKIHRNMHAYYIGASVILMYTMQEIQ